VEDMQAAEIVKTALELLAGGFMSQAGKELLTTIQERFVGQIKAEGAIAKLEAAPESSPEAVKILEVLLEAEIIKDDSYAERLQQLMGMIKDERLQSAATDLQATGFVEIDKIDQSISISIGGQQVAAKNITAQDIKIGVITQQQ
jgi:phosphate starvation-inducible protein PhoH